MSLERIFKALVGLGLSETDSRIYICIAIKGSMRARTLIEELEINKQQLYPILKKLQRKKIIKMNNSRPLIVTAVPFEIVLEMLINSKIIKSKEILENKKELISHWKSAKWNNNT